MGKESPRFIVIGAGMAGILSAIKLRERGYDFTVYEKADRLGGTWRENTYPGVACDVPSHLYRYSFAPNAEWSHIFSPGSEILAYLEGVARSFNVMDTIEFGAEIETLSFHDDRWHLTTTDGRTDEADYVIAATGVLHHPSYPDIEGLDTFSGTMFHTARWDHSVPLAGKRVGLIGTGSTSVQVTTAIVDTVGELCVFQRTPQWVLPMDNNPIDEADKVRYREDPSTMAEVKAGLAASFENNFASAVVDKNSPTLVMLEQTCRANIENNVTDPELRAKLTPDYRAACKRLIISPDFYQKIQSPNAQVITEPIARIEPEGVRTKDGVLHELDVLVLATGFRVDQFLRPIHVTGRDGVSLDEVWAKRPSAYLAISVPEFPNLFMLNGPNGPVGNFSLIDVAELQFEYIMQLVDATQSNGQRQISASHEAAERFEEERSEAAQNTVWVTGCRSWYLDDRGVPAAWPWGFDRFRAEMSSPKLEDYELV